ncbi:hypothetical protein [Candidatus Phytoplasma pruni]|uniref:Uncharacterized protein n=1 Tax=Candidatus Phytoplasma pruni TaxID=479893 RepID=A0A851HH21_9MOLU|nr:hypothetical protein [Candidatus Phytoplasma pruni]NWN45574.1 hypothetical protein [Candidatus Phytoplasma pruni]
MLDLKDVLHNLIQTDYFTAVASVAITLSVVWVVLRIKKLQFKKDYREELRDLIQIYIGEGEMSVKEYTLLLRKMAHLGNYTGVYRDSVYKMIRELGENGDIQFSENIFETEEIEAERKKAAQNDELVKQMLQENLNLKKQLENKNNPVLIDTDEYDWHKNK